MIQAVALWIVASKSFANRRHRLSQAKVRSTPSSSIPSACADGTFCCFRPSTRQQFEALGDVRALDDFKRPFAKLGELFGKLWACIATIGEEMAQPGIQRADRLDDANGAVAVLDIGRVNIDANQMTKRVGDDVALAPLDLLAGIKSVRSAGFGSPRRV